MKIGTPAVLPDWFEHGSIVIEPELADLNEAGAWYFLIVRQHGLPIEDARPIWEIPQWHWRRCRVPLGAIWPAEFAHQDPDRLTSIRTANSVPPIIVEFIDDGRVRLLDGGHRITIARETNAVDIDAFVGNPTI